MPHIETWTVRFKGKSCKEEDKERELDELIRRLYSCLV